MNYTRKLLHFICFVSICFALSIIFIKLYVSSVTGKIIYPSDDIYSYIAHAGGAIDGITYTNSLEALNLSLSKGFKAVELDLIKTSDNVLIAGHDWAHFKNIIGNETVDEQPMHSSAISKYKIHEKYTIITSADISNILAQNPQLILFTDKSNDFQLIKDIGFDARVYVEVFGVLNYIKAIFSDIKNPVLNVDIGRFGYVYAMARIVFLDPRLVALSVNAVKEYPYYLDWLRDRNLKVFIYTSNDENVIKEMIEKYDATIYVDFYDFKGGK